MTLESLDPRCPLLLCYEAPGLSSALISLEQGSTALGGRLASARGISIGLATPIPQVARALLASILGIDNGRVNDNKCPAGGARA